ncbi:MAG: helix-turn-helix transcriptional regulator [Deltaproteobacteria bacterium]|nr:helix-turn-helix transcriptional regulator [Deltaproteobacteria bacterium]
MPRKKELTDDAEGFGPRLARLRHAAGYTQREFATQVGISHRMIAYYEAQAKHPPTHIMAVLSKLLGVSADELLGIKPVKEKRAKKVGSEHLWRRFKQIEKLPPADQRTVLKLVDALCQSRGIGAEH